MPLNSDHGCSLTRTLDTVARGTRTSPRIAPSFSKADNVTTSSSPSKVNCAMSLPALHIAGGSCGGTIPVSAFAALWGWLRSPGSAADRALAHAGISEFGLLHREHLINRPGKSSAQESLVGRVLEAYGATRLPPEGETGSRALRDRAKRPASTRRRQPIRSAKDTTIPSGPRP